MPVQEWINKQLRGRIRDTLAPHQSGSGTISNRTMWKSCSTNMSAGRRDHSMAVWALFMFELWHREFMDGRTSVVEEAGYRPVVNVGVH